MVECKAPCEDVKCGNHAYCKPDGNEAYCICEDGWTFNPSDISAGCIGEFVNQIVTKNCNKKMFIKSQISMNVTKSMDQVEDASKTPFAPTCLVLLLASVNQVLQATLTSNVQT